MCCCCCCCLPHLLLLFCVFWFAAVAAVCWLLLTFGCVAVPLTHPLEMNVGEQRNWICIKTCYCSCLMKAQVRIDCMNLTIACLIEIGFKHLGLNGVSSHVGTSRSHGRCCPGGCGGAAQMHRVRQGLQDQGRLDAPPEFSQAT